MRQYALDTASRFAQQSERTKPKATYTDGKIVQCWSCQSLTRSGVKYNRLLRFRRRCLQPDERVVY